MQTVSFTLPTDLIVKIDQNAGSRKRSGLVRHAIVQYLERKKKEKAWKQLMEFRKNIKSNNCEKSVVEMIREDRKNH